MVIQTDTSGRTLGEERLQEWLALVEAGKRVLVIDACHVGKAIHRLASLDLPVARGIEGKAAIARLMKATGTSVLAVASGKKQVLVGVVENGQGRGLFTPVLLKGRVPPTTTQPSPKPRGYDAPSLRP